MIINFLLLCFLISVHRPCINHIPSMKQFRSVQPDDAEVLRDGHWIRYDHASLVVGDIVRLVEGDVIPADCSIISLGMDHADASRVVDVETSGNGTPQGLGGGKSSNSGMDIIVDSHLVTGELKPRQISNNANGAVNSTTLYYGSRILQGACIAVVTATGDRVMLAKLIKARRWPPKTDLSEEVEEINRMEYLETGIALTPIS